MSEKKQKLELTWIGKEKRPRLEQKCFRNGIANNWHMV